ncbi:SDR family oxidoreductase [Neobacillus sp. PS3-40]|uniref:SDR family NAD(P)-dependent oxidoreductase n=1 Tax=Neobacillus sp. PS3-40 TaxID=3070679 RepID=UPI0027E006F5|nr:SDR family oxidoreductase [Neobacillus sp. PS3-40]WML43060.1 SDR family oxidoreductase [Neobacillus sp. PS3-40]
MKTMIVTGAGSGLGKELAILLCQQGFHLVLAGRTLEKLSSVKNEIEALGGRADILPMDIRNQEEVNKQLAEMSGRFSLYGLVNNAGIGHFGPFIEISEQQMNEMFETNVFGTINMTKAILPYLKKQGEGHVLNIISTAGLRGKVNEAVYVASKFAVRGFTESLQKEYEGTKIKFTAVYMGGMDTPFWKNNNNHIQDPSRFRSAKEVAEIILEQIVRDSIIIDSKKG